jgi:hypothetical protein
MLQLIMDARILLYEYNRLEKSRTSREEVLNQ